MLFYRGNTGKLKFLTNYYQRPLGAIKWERIFISLRVVAWHLFVPVFFVLLLIYFIVSFCFPFPELLFIAPSENDWHTQSTVSVIMIGDTKPVICSRFCGLFPFPIRWTGQLTLTPPQTHLSAARFTVTESWVRISLRSMMMKITQAIIIFVFIFTEMSQAITTDIFTELFDYKVGEKTERPIIGRSFVIVFFHQKIQRWEDIVYSNITV